MVEFGKRSTTDSVQVVILHNARIHTSTMVPRSTCIGDVVSMFADGAAKCYIHSIIVQDASYMQPEFLGKRLDASPYKSCNAIVLELYDCIRPFHICQLNHVNMCSSVSRN